MSCEPKLRDLEYPAQEVEGTRGVNGLNKMSVLGDPPERHAPPKEKDRRWNQGHRAEKREQAEGIGEERLPELEPDRVSEAGGESATWAWQMRYSQEGARRESELGVRAVAACRWLQPKGDRKHAAGGREQANGNGFVGLVIHADASENLKNESSSFRPTTGRDPQQKGPIR